MIKILLADDHAIVRSGIKLLINSQSDMQVVSESADGAETVRKALEKKPDIVIMDLNMPEKNGLIATKQIKEESNENIKIIILTMHDEKEYISRALQAGASGFVLKSHNVNDLIEAIRTVHRGEAFLDPNATKILIHDYVKLSHTNDHQQQPLTGREQEVLSYLAMGFTNKEVADKLFVSVKTIESHRANIMKKLEISTRHELVEYAIHAGLFNLTYKNSDEELTNK
ncbi:MAG TPA: response regulator transcription factor [Bacillota bacterium]|nr:response regulator transcription factor [Bacillota bacterium]